MHIGKRIHEIVRQRQVTVGWLAAHIPCERSNVYNIYGREYVNTDLLFTLSRLLGHDFFADLSRELGDPAAAG